MQTAGIKGYHLSKQQARMWSLHMDHGDCCARCTVMLEGPLDIDVLEQAFNQVIERHTILRTVFYSPPGMTLPLQMVIAHRQISCSVLNLEELPAECQLQLLQAMLASARRASFDLEHGPLLRLWSLRFAPDRHLLSLSLSAFCADAATLKLLITEVSQAYTALIQHTADEDAFEQTPLQYVDVCAWQNKLLLASDTEEQRAYWRRQDLSDLPYYRFPFERAVPQGDHVLDDFSFALDAALGVQIEALAQRCEVTTQSVLLASWQAFLWRLTGRKLPVLGIACDGRHYEELATIPGLYTRYVPFSSQISEDCPFQQLVTDVGASLEEAIEEQEYFSWELFKSSQEPDAMSIASFPVAFEYLSWPAELRAGPLNLRLQQCSCTDEPCTLKLTALQCGTHIQLSLHYDPARLEHEMLQPLADSFRVFLRHALQQPERSIGQLDLLDLRQQLGLIDAFTGLRLPLPSLSLSQLFEAQVERTPHQIALVCDSEQLSYRQLNTRANQLAHYLQKQGVGPDVLVALIVDRSIDMFVCMLGILKAGGAYVPLDSEQPSARLASVLSQLQAPLLLTREYSLPLLPASSSHVLCLEHIASEIAQQPDEPVPYTHCPENLAYIIYTSGSTGNPKGVMIRHRNVVNYTLAMLPRIAPQPGLQFANVSTLAADLGNTVIFCSLVSGGCLHVLSYETITNGQAFARALKEHPIDVLKIVPSHLRALLASSQGNEILPRKQLILGGEAFPLDLLTELRALGATCAIMNHYGPTETTIGALVNPLSTETEIGEQVYARIQGYPLVPLGRPIANTRAYILDQQQRIVPVGSVGELYLAGDGLAAGYLDQPEQTEQKFLTVSLPSSPMGEGQAATPVRVYRTGDLARYTPHREIQFVGRADTQIKLRGHRIEMEEVEAHLLRHPQVQNCTVMLSNEQKGEPRLVAYIVSQQENGPEQEELRAYLSEHLPEVMIPGDFVFLETLPLTPNGKVDRQQLRSLLAEDLLPLASHKKNSVPFVRPRDSIEFQLQMIWEDILNVRPIGVMDNFFERGGHSILAIRLMSQIYQHFEQDLALATLFQHPTIADLAVVLRQQNSAEMMKALVPIKPGGSKLPFFCIHPSGGTVFRYYDLAHYLGSEQPFYGLQTPDLDGKGNTYNKIEDLSAHYISAIQRIQPEGPYLLGGWSSGGVMAFEMAQQLVRQGEKVALLALFDTQVPAAYRNPASPREPLDVSDPALARQIIQHINVASISEEFEQCMPEEQLRFALEQAKRRNIVPLDTNLEQFRRFARIQHINVYAVHTYVPQVYPYQITLFLAQGLPSQEELATSVTRRNWLTQAWGDLARGGVEVHLVPGDHTNMVDVPHVQVLAETLNECLKRC